MKDKKPVEEAFSIVHSKIAEDLGFAIIAYVYPYRVEYQIFKNSDLDLPEGSWAPYEFEVDLPQEDLYLHGSVKWDGCSNWHFDEQDRVMLHGCDRKDLLNIGEVMALCWDWTPDLCKNWNP